MAADDRRSEEISGQPVQTSDCTSVSAGASGSDGALRSRLGGALAETDPAFFTALAEALAFDGAFVTTAALRPVVAGVFPPFSFALAFATAAFSRWVFSSSRIRARAALMTSARCGSEVDPIGWTGIG